MPTAPAYSRPGQKNAPPWNKVADYFKRRYGERVQKIPLDAGFSCPNRDGSLSTAGCVFCNPLGSGTGLGLHGLSLAEQWEERCAPQRQRGVRLFLAYLQSFSNTYGPIEKLAAVLQELKPLPGLVGLAVGTRPDCVDKAKLELIASVCAAENWGERWIEFGVQSSNDATLERIKRGHDIACAAWAIQQASAAGLKVCIHLMAGLPGENSADFLESLRWASGQPIDGIKFHCLYICRGSALAAAYRRGEYKPWSEEEYIEALTLALPLLRPEIIVQRISGDPAPEELLAPEWCARSHEISNKLLSKFTRQNIWQGQAVQAG